MTTASWPSVTAIVATRDRPELLIRAVSAILRQHYPGQLDCVVVFDQSEPHEIPVSVPDGRQLTTIRNTRTPGLPGGRNSGILSTDADLIAFCDDDDEWLPGKLKAQVELLMANPLATVASCGILVRFNGYDRERLPPQEALGYENFLQGRIMEVHPSTIVARRDILLSEIGLVDEEIPGGYAEDWEWLLRAARSGPVVSVLRPLTRVHWHASSFFFDRWKTIVSALDYLLAKHPAFATQPAGIARVKGQIAFAYAGMGDKRMARSVAGEALRSNWKDRRALTALVVSSGVVEAETITRIAHRFGRGV